MSARARLRRTGSALAIAGIFLSTVRVDRDGDIAPASAETAIVTPATPLAVAAQKAPEAGDLTHLTFTATGALTSSLVAPADDGVAAGTSASIEVETVAGAGVELRVGDAVIPFSRIGKRTVDTKTGVTRYTYYGVPLAAGPNTIALTPLGADGLRGATMTHRVYAPGRVASLRVEASGPFRADGATAEQVRIEAADAWGHRAAADQLVQLALVTGDARLERVAADPAAAVNPAETPVPLATSSPGASGTARQTIGVTLGAAGEATLRLVPGLQSGEIVLRAECGDVAGDARFFLSPNLRTPFVTGLVTAGTGAVPGPPGEADGGPDGTASRRGRIALYGSGAVGGSLATFAYDTANTLQRTPAYGGAYADDPNERPYTITGDTSTRRDDALSRDHLYARLDRGRSTAMWGEFRARTGADDAALGSFDQLVDGAKLDLGGSGRRATIFAARNDVGYDRRVFAPSGLASGVALRPQIVVGSETIVLATLDARTGAVVSQTPLTRGIDYTLEYATGQLQFIDVPLPFDDAFNPRQIVVTYEFDAPGNAARTVGGRADVALGRGGAVRLGLGYVNDTSGAGNITLASQDLRGTLPGGAWSIVHATSQGALPALNGGGIPAGGGGGALHAQLTRALGGDRLTMAFDRTASGYDDPFGGLATPGLLNERLAWSHRDPGGRGEIGFDVAHQANVGAGIAGSSQTTATLRARRALSKRVTLNASLERRLASSDAAAPVVATPAPGATPQAFGYQPTGDQTSTQAALGVDWRLTGALSLSANRLQTLGGQNDVEPAQTDAQATYDLGKGGRLYLRERWSDAPVQSFAASTQAFTAPTGGTRATQFGIQRTLGAATTLDSTWTIDHGANGGDVYAATGVRERIGLGPLRGDAFFQHGTAVGAAAAGFDLYGLSLSYADRSNRFRVSGSSQLRTGTGAGVSLSLAAIGAISPELSLFTSIQDARATGSDQADERAGLAWRPSRSDAGVTLLQYERRDGSSAIDNTQSGVLSLEQVVRVRTRTEIVGRYAYKLDGDAYYAAHSALAGLRVAQRIGSRFDLGVEGRRSTVRGIDGADATALAVEGGVRLGGQLRLAVGYNVNGTADPSLATAPTHRGIYATVTSVIDRLFGWGRTSP